jgi:hypothetical protein
LAAGGGVNTNGIVFEEFIVDLARSSVHNTNRYFHSVDANGMSCDGLKNAS